MSKDSKGHGMQVQKNEVLVKNFMIYNIFKFLRLHSF